MQPLTTYIAHPELLDAEAVDELERLVDRHPTYQAARLLLVRGLFQLQDSRFGPALRQAALMVPDRAKLFDLIEGDKFRTAAPPAPAAPPSPSGADADRTRSLIDGFLAAQPEEPRPRRPRPADASADYTSYLLQLEDAQAAPTPAPPAQTTPQEDAAPPAAEAAPPAPAPATADPGDDIPEEEQNVPSEAYFTETLARIYIKQCKYDKAIEIIRRLSLNYPKKSRYFADQIRFLEKILLNEQAKNTESNN